jgi:hypothetical protein
MKTLKQSNKLIIAIASNQISTSMQLILEISKILNLKVLWLKHTRTDSKREFSPDGDNYSSSNLEVLNCQTSDEHAEGFFLDGILSTDYQGWILRLDDDELVTKEFLNSLLLILDSLNPKIVYSLPRIWVRKICDIWCQSKLAKASNSDTDNQVRLFHTNYVSADKNLHTPGFSYRKKKELNLGQNLVHLIWEIQNVESRIQKIRHYEELQSGAGVGKLRYYLPEVFPDSLHVWPPLENQSEVDILEIWINKKD